MMPRKRPPLSRRREAHIMTGEIDGNEMEQEIAENV